MSGHRRIEPATRRLLRCKHIEGKRTLEQGDLLIHSDEIHDANEQMYAIWRPPNAGLDASRAEPTVCPSGKARESRSEYPFEANINLINL